MDLEWPQKNESNGRLSRVCRAYALGVLISGMRVLKIGIRVLISRIRVPIIGIRVPISGIRVPIIGIRVPIIGILSTYGSWHVGTIETAGGPAPGFALPRRKARRAAVPRPIAAQAVLW